jgi:hypothetical protein
MSQSHRLSDPGARDDNQASRRDFPIPCDPTLMRSWAVEQQQHPSTAGSLHELWGTATDPLWQQNMDWTSGNPGDSELLPANPTLELFRLAPYAPSSQPLPTFSGNEICQSRSTPLDPSRGEEHGVGNNLWPNPNPTPRKATEWPSGQISLTPDAARHAAQRHPSRSETPKCGQEVHIPRARYVGPYDIDM